ncbi:nucleotidyl transferase AbiEii/AbiGii toxin family protein [Acidiferrobacter sp.]|uniref:nucleotidyl transferase AbiEii/AbiGii toxin family protein n=1 Tax=Acidiferrobacter sp. TaxID=1872107 RepID=UPI00263134E3|nr:nucleotidyl transferase AbiEii/AbiGii toxin family protein [Acidiferrobacter sp.]
MKPTLSPHFTILPPAQRRLWPDLRLAPRLGFTLYGGTAIALRLGHRHSVDFDFFSAKPLDREAIKAAFPFMAYASTLQDHANTWVVSAPSGSSEQETVKVSFFGMITFGRVGNPDLTADGVLSVASFEDLMATKLKVILQRAESRDYRDIVAMIQAGVSLSHGLSAARLLFGSHFQPSESLKALTYFQDGDLPTLPASEKAILIDAVSKVRALPEVTLRSQELSGLDSLESKDCAKTSPQ